EAAIEPARRRGRIGDAVVDPQRDRGTCELDPAERRGVVAPALDRVEVGDVERRKRMDREQPVRDVERIACRGERGYDRRIEVALAHAGADHHAALEIENRNDLHRAPPTYRM